MVDPVGIQWERLVHVLGVECEDTTRSIPKHHLCGSFIQESFFGSNTTRMAIPNCQLSWIDERRSPRSKPPEINPKEPPFAAAV
jgi:hypothetical protein